MQGGDINDGNLIRTFFISLNLPVIIDIVIKEL